jgi:Rieske Fe-S protein
VNDLSRRSVLRGGVVVAVGGVAGFVFARNSGAAKPKSPTAAANGYGPAAGTGRSLTTLGAVPDGGGVVLRDADVVVTRSGSTVHAFSATCTHEGCQVGSVANGLISCPCHGSQFDATTGAVARGPATRPLPEVAVTVQGQSVVQT